MGSYRLGLLSRTTLENGEEVDLFSARDALVLKALALVLGSRLSFSRNCTHLKGNGGGKGAVRRVWRHLKQHRFVIRTDVKSYYASIDHQRLIERLAQVIQDRRVLNLIERYLRRTAEQGGLFWESEGGIPLGSPLSPIIGAFFLKELDERLERTGLFYVRFMDDILVLAPSRWKLRRAVRVLNRVLSSLELAKHPEKTFIGRIEKGFDFLGYHFSRTELTVAKATLENFAARALRLYEQEPGESWDSSLLGEYVQRWFRWVRAGVDRKPWQHVGVGRNGELSRVVRYARVDRGAPHESHGVGAPRVSERWPLQSAAWRLLNTKIPDMTSMAISKTIPLLPSVGI